MNTLDIVLVTFGEDQHMVDEINRTLGIDLRLMSDSAQCGGQKVVVFESYGYCGPVMNALELKRLVEVFQRVECNVPEYATLFVSNDSCDAYNGIIKKETGE